MLLPNSQMFMREAAGLREVLPRLISLRDLPRGVIDSRSAHSMVKDPTMWMATAVRALLKRVEVLAAQLVAQANEDAFEKHSTRLLKSF